MTDEATLTVLEIGSKLRLLVKVFTVTEPVEFKRPKVPTVISFIETDPAPERVPEVSVIPYEPLSVPCISTEAKAPLSVTFSSRFTVMPKGIMTASVVERVAEGPFPPHVDATDQLPLAEAVYVVAFEEMLDTNTIRSMIAAVNIEFVFFMSFNLIISNAFLGLVARHK